jgi:hypothetical protein
MFYVKVCRSEAVQKHTTCRWIMLYVEHWLKADVQQPDGTIIKREKGTPQVRCRRKVNAAKAA